MKTSEAYQKVTDHISYPCYDPSGDRVYIQNLSWFKSSDAYYSALFHELVHSTGHSARLDRFSADDKDAATKKINYSREELVAELGAAYLATIADLNPDLTKSAAYIKGWAKCLTENPNWISYAASRAIKACDFILASSALPELVPEVSTEDVPF